MKMQETQEDLYISKKETLDVGELVIIDSETYPFYNGLFAKVTGKAFGGGVYVEVLSSYAESVEELYLFKNEFILPRVSYEER